MSDEAGYFPLPTDTAHVKVEGKQYRIFNVDLGEGIARSRIVVGAAIFIPWCILLSLLDVSFFSAVWLYIGPPALMISRAVQLDPGDRPNYVRWIDRIRFIFRRHQQMIELPGKALPNPKPFVARGAVVVLDPNRIELRTRGKKHAA